MKKAKLMLSAIAIFGVVGGAFAYKMATKQLYYKLGAACNAQRSLTTIPNSAGTVTVTPGATGWYTTPACTGSTFRAYTIAD